MASAVSRIGKRVVVLLTATALTAVLNECYKTAKPVSVQQRTNVFTEVTDALPPREGMVHLTLKASVKTPTPEHYLEGFPFELEVDGQEIIWKVKGALEKTPVSGPEGRLPEGGEGRSVSLQARITWYSVCRTMTTTPR